VELSMANIKELIRERDEAVNKLQFGRKEKHPGRWEYTPFGFMQYVKPKEHLVPKFMNKYWASQKRQYDPYMKKYINLWLEKVKKERWRRARMEYKRIQKLKARFPDSDMWKEEKDR
ncbi:putative 39S ribosomal protein L47, mitochondrial, partial [Apostichopus japonicus]